MRRGGVVGGVHDHNTRPMSTTSVASEYFRYFTGIAIISFNYPTKGERMMVVIVMFSHGGSVGRMLSGGVVRDSNEAEYCLKTHVLIPM